MTPALRPSTATIIVVTLALGALLLTIALELALLLTRHPASTDVAQLSAPDARILITAVPTVEHVSSLLPTPTLPASLDVQTASDQWAGVSAPVTSAVPLIPGPLVDPSLSLRTGPVAVPLQIQIPALKINAPVLGVGLNMNNAMSTPRGILPNNSLWQTVFWYRGGGIPGDVGTATFAGHYDDVLGRPAIFAYLGDLRTGDLIVIRDQRSELSIPFVVTEMKSYTNEEASDPAVLARIFGSSSVSAADTQPVQDQVSRLTLITCAGSWVNGSFDLRLVVYATRANYPF